MAVAPQRGVVVGAVGRAVNDLRRAQLQGELTPAAATTVRSGLATIREQLAGTDDPGVAQARAAVDELAARAGIDPAGAAFDLGQVDALRGALWRAAGAVAAANGGFDESPGSVRTLRQQLLSFDEVDQRGAVEGIRSGLSGSTARSLREALGPDAHPGHDDADPAVVLARVHLRAARLETQVPKVALDGPASVLRRGAVDLLAEQLALAPEVVADLRGPNGPARDASAELVRRQIISGGLGATNARTGAALVQLAAGETVLFGGGRPAALREVGSRLGLPDDVVEPVARAHPNGSTRGVEFLVDEHLARALGSDDAPERFLAVDAGLREVVGTRHADRGLGRFLQTPAAGRFALDAGWVAEQQAEAQRTGGASAAGAARVRAVLASATPAARQAFVEQVAADTEGDLGKRLDRIDALLELPGWRRPDLGSLRGWAVDQLGTIPAALRTPGSHDSGKDVYDALGIVVRLLPLVEPTGPAHAELLRRVDALAREIVATRGRTNGYSSYPVYEKVGQLAAQLELAARLGGASR